MKTAIAQPEKPILARVVKIKDYRKLSRQNKGHYEAELATSYGTGLVSGPRRFLLIARTPKKQNVNITAQAPAEVTFNDLAISPELTRCLHASDKTMQSILVKGACI